MFKDQTILITGGTGSWGHELVRQLLAKDPKEIRIFSRGELAQVNMERSFKNDKLSFIIGDIRSKEALTEALEQVDYVFHLAALKHVPVCEVQPTEAIQTNIIGTENLIYAAIKNNVKKVIDVSTDKAVNPLNVYGMTKAVGERLIVQANMKYTDTQFVCIRAGNVLGSNGSIVPFFINQLETNQPLTITHNEMTRYFITLQEAIRLLFTASEESKGGEIFVMKMPSYRIRDIAEVLRERWHKEYLPIKEIGIRAGEKLDEVLISEYEAKQTYQYDDHYYVIMPTLPIEGIEVAGLEKVTFDSYTSKDFLLPKEEVENLLVKGGFLK